MDALALQDPALGSAHCWRSAAATHPSEDRQICVVGYQASSPTRMATAVVVPVLTWSSCCSASIHVGGTFVRAPRITSPVFAGQRYSSASLTKRDVAPEPKMSPS